MRNFKRKYNTDKSREYETMELFRTGTGTVKQIVKPHQNSYNFKRLYDAQIINLAIVLHVKADHGRGKYCMA